MSTLAVVEAILREAAMPLSVREIVERAGDALPTKSKTPDTVVARDLSMDIKRKGDGSTFVRTSPGRYAMRDQAAAQLDGAQPTAIAPTATPVSLSTATVASSISPAPASPPSIDSAGTSLVGQSLPHDRNGPRAAPPKAASKPQSNSEDTPMSA
jgi:hypothetical protein